MAQGVADSPVVSFYSASVAQPVAEDTTRNAFIRGLEPNRHSSLSPQKSPWSVKELRKQRLNLIAQAFKGKNFFLIIDETGDKKKEKKDRNYSKIISRKLGKNRQAELSR